MEAIQCSSQQRRSIHVRSCGAFKLLDLSAFLDRALWIGPGSSTTTGWIRRDVHRWSLSGCLRHGTPAHYRRRCGQDRARHFHEYRPAGWSYQLASRQGHLKSASSSKPKAQVSRCWTTTTMAGSTFTSSMVQPTKRSTARKHHPRRLSFTTITTELFQT